MILAQEERRDPIDSILMSVGGMAVKDAISGGGENYCLLKCPASTVVSEPGMLAG